MANDRSAAIDPQKLARWYEEYSHRLRAFLWGLLRDTHRAEEALQATFARAASHGGRVQPGSEKAWLFEVAFNEAMTIRRSDRQDQKHREQLQSQSPPKRFPADFEVMRQETVERVRRAVASLPEEQQQIVRRRIYGEQTFQQIADELNLPLGTILTRMRLALKKLQQVLKQDQ